MITGRRSSFFARCAERGYTLEEVRPCIVAEDGDTITVDELHESYPHPKPSGDPTGPGTELKALLSKIGIKSSPTCSCNKRAKIMDEKGCAWCEENIQEIVGWLKEEHAKRKSIIPFIPLAVEQVVKLAIRRARKKGNSQ